MTERQTISLTAFQRRILEGLSDGNNHYISASEMPEFGFMAANDLAGPWMSQHGVPMWRITDKGRQLWRSLNDEDAMPEVM